MAIAWQYNADGLLDITGAAQRHADMGQRFGPIRLQRQCLADQISGGGVSSCLVAQDAEQMQCAEITLYSPYAGSARISSSTRA